MIVWFVYQVVPDPQAYFVSHWGNDPYAGMAYSYIPVGCSGQEYEEIAKDIESKVFFAGEVTNCYILM